MPRMIGFIFRVKKQNGREELIPGWKIIVCVDEVRNIEEYICENLSWLLYSVHC